MLLFLLFATVCSASETIRGNAFISKDIIEHSVLVSPHQLSENAGACIIASKEGITVEARIADCTTVVDANDFIASKDIFRCLNGTGNSENEYLSDVIWKVTPCSSRLGPIKSFEMKELYWGNAFQLEKYKKIFSPKQQNFQVAISEQLYDDLPLDSIYAVQVNGPFGSAFCEVVAFDETTESPSAIKLSFDALHFITGPYKDVLISWKIVTCASNEFGPVNSEKKKDYLGTAFLKKIQSNFCQLDIESLSNSYALIPSFLSNRKSNNPLTVPYCDANCCIEVEDMQTGQKILSKVIDFLDESNYSNLNIGLSDEAMVKLVGDKITRSNVKWSFVRCKENNLISRFVTREIREMDASYQESSGEHSSFEQLYQKNSDSIGELSEQSPFNLITERKQFQSRPSKKSHIKVVRYSLNSNSRSAASKFQSKVVNNFFSLYEKNYGFARITQLPYAALKNYLEENQTEISNCYFENEYLVLLPENMYYYILNTFGASCLKKNELFLRLENSIEMVNARIINYGNKNVEDFFVSPNVISKLSYKLTEGMLVDWKLLSKSMMDNYGVPMFHDFPREIFHGNVTELDLSLNDSRFSSGIFSKNRIEKSSFIFAVVSSRHLYRNAKCDQGKRNKIFYPNVFVEITNIWNGTIIVVKVAEAIDKCDMNALILSPIAFSMIKEGNEEIIPVNWRFISKTNE